MTGVQTSALPISCDIIEGCDGFHGIGRQAIPASELQVFDREFPFSWLGILSESPPLKEMTYCNHDRGYALVSRRSPQIARLYLQCTNDDDLANWSDARIWDELHLRIGDEARTELKEGRIFQRGITPCRSFVSAPMQYGRLFLAGDASHIVPPTGAKGLNLAASDVHYLSQAFREYYDEKSTAGIDGYSAKALARVWKAVRFSWWMTSMLHRFDDHDAFDRRLQLAELDHVTTSRAAGTALAETYVGLPFATI